MILNYLLRSDAERKLLFLRGSVLFSLICSTIIFGGLSYYVFYNLEGKLLQSEYKAIKEQFNIVIHNDINDKKESLLALSVYLQSEFPNASSWPNVGVPMQTFKDFSDPLISMGDSRTISYSPIVYPEDVESFENFAYNFFEDQGYPDLGISTDFGQGISARNTTSGSRYHDNDASSAAGTRDLLVPVYQIGNLDQNSAAVMYNIYSEANRAAAIDFVLDCQSHLDCTAVTDFIYIVQDTYFRPAALMMHPVFGYDMKGNNVTTGIVVAVFNWDDVLLNSVPIHADGLEATIKSSSGAESIFAFESGEAVLKDKPSSSARSSLYSVEVMLEHTSFAINLTPTDKFISNYRSFGPTIACIIAISISLFISFIFIIYDLAMNREKREQEIMMETKRLFVRYISHEIRTPLNTVHLGLQVLHEEMRELIDNGDLDQFQLLKEAMDEWTNFISGIDESTEDAITVVSDLIDFDKLTTGMLNIERGIHDIWGLITDTVKPFAVQARSKNIRLNLDLIPKVAHGNTSDVRVSKLITFGDSVKLQQVLRNLISNALKFSPENGEVKITACWEKNTEIPEDLAIPDGHFPLGAVVVQVTDSGAGMTTEQVNQLFQEGVQFDANKLQAGQGSGLGLWISKGVVEQHCGQLSAISEGKGHGSEFTCELPVFLSDELTSSAWYSILPSPRISSLRHSSSHSPMNSTPKLTKNNSTLLFQPKSVPSSSIRTSSSSLSEKKLSFPTKLSSSSSSLPSPSSSPINPTTTTKVKSTTRTTTHSTLLSTSTRSQTSEGSNHSLSSSPAFSSSSASFPSSSSKLNIDRPNVSPKPRGGGNTTLLMKYILVVDDAASTRKVMCRLLKNAGCRTAEASNGQECLDIVAKEQFDLILMDYEMPIMNGPTATNKLRELGCKTPVVGLTGNVVKEDIMFFIDHGAVEVLTKPLKVASLKDMMKRVFYISSKVSSEEAVTSNSKLSQNHSLSLKELTSTEEQEEQDNSHIVSTTPTSSPPLATSSSPTLAPLATSSTSQMPASSSIPEQGLTRRSSSNRKIMLVTDDSSPGVSPNSLLLAEEAAKNALISFDSGISSSVAARRRSFESNHQTSKSFDNNFSGINKNNKILVVDDVTSTRKVICRLLKNCGCEYKEAVDGQECLDMVAKEQFDLILMDYEMPIMNGPTATNKLRKLGCKIPVVGVTGNVLKSDTDYFIRQGALEVLHKPLNVKVVKQLLSRHLKSFNSFVRPKKPSFQTPPQTAGVSTVEDHHIMNSQNDETKNDADDDENVESEWFMMALNV